MTRFSKTILLMGTAVFALSACASDKGPGKLGTKDDIVVHNNGMPSAKTAAAPDAAKAPGEAFSSTVEQGTANPAPEVAAAEAVPAPDATAQAAAAATPSAAASQPLPDTSPEMETAVKQQQAANAPLASTTGTNPVDATTAAPSETRPLDAMAPAQPVGTAVTPPTQPAPTPAATATATSAPSSVYPTTDYSAPAAAPAPTPTPAATSSVPYPLDKNAPYSPKAVAAAQAAAGVTPTTAPITATTTSTSSVMDASVIRSAQTALAAKGGYTGPQTGAIDAEFLNALTKYQGANNLPMGGLNAETLKSLGVTQ